MRKKRLKSLEVDVAKGLKITNYLFGAVSSQSSVPSKPEGTGSREEREGPSEPRDTSSTVSQGFAVEML